MAEPTAGATVETTGEPTGESTAETTAKTTAASSASAAASAASDPAGRCPSPSSEPADDEPARARAPPAWRYRFFVNRFARLVPTYWLMLAIALPPTIAGFSMAGGMGINPRDTNAIVTSTVLSVFGVATVAGTLPTPPINPTGWFVCALLWCYVAFPFILRPIERLSDRQLAAGVAWAYWVGGGAG